LEYIARTPKQIGAAIRFQRHELVLKQSEVGEKTNLRQATISKLEAGDPGTQLSTLCDVLAALNLELVVRWRTKSSKALIEEIF